MSLTPMRELQIHRVINLGVGVVFGSVALAMD